MKLNKIVVAFGLGMTLVSGSALAAAGAGAGNGTVTFKGAIIEAPCSIEPGSIDQTIDLGQISKGSLESGGRSMARPFQIKLENCDTTTQKEVTVTFSGSESTEVPKTLGIAGTASGAGIALTNGGNELIELGKATKAQKLANGNNQLNFTAYLQGATGSALIVPGNFMGVANFTLAYQ